MILGSKDHTLHDFMKKYDLGSNKNITFRVLLAERDLIYEHSIVSYCI